MQLSKTALIALLASSAGFAADREIIELQRDVAAVQEQVRTLQRTIDERMAALTALVQQALESGNKANNSLAGLDKAQERLTQQIAAPVAGLSTKMDQMSNDFTTVRESVADLNERISKVQTQLVDLNNTVKVLQSPAAPPPPGGVGALGSASGSPPPGMSAKELYDSASRDRSTGNVDLAMQGFQEYLKWYSTTELAPNAQFYVGQIYYDKTDYSNAIQAFDAVLEKFQENNKTADAMYMKGMALLKSGQRTEAAQEFLTVAQKFPNSEVAAKARSQRKALGLNTPGSTSTRKRR